MLPIRTETSTTTIFRVNSGTWTRLTVLLADLAHLASRIARLPRRLAPQKVYPPDLYRSLGPIGARWPADGPTLH